MAGNESRAANAGVFAVFLTCAFWATTSTAQSEAPVAPTAPELPQVTAPDNPQISPSQAAPDTPPVTALPSREPAFVENDAPVSADTESSAAPTVDANIDSPDAIEAEAEMALSAEMVSEGLEPAEATAPEDIAEEVVFVSTREQLEAATKLALNFLSDGGPSIWAIAALSVVTVALILWKIWRLALIGAWSRGKAMSAVDRYVADDTDSALKLVKHRRGLRSKVVFAAITSKETLPEESAREETARVAKQQIGDASVGLRALELIATIAPLLGLLGTVMGMIAAFQALQESGSRADPSLLAGGIWEALLTTAAGMAVAIPASAALTWFEAVIDRMRRDIEDAAMRVFVARKQAPIQVEAPLAAE